jgi:outer membrane protein W
MKKLVLSLLIVALAFNLNAQEKGKFRGGLDVGLALPNAGAGFNGNIDLRYNIMDNWNAGVKFGLAALAKDFSMASTGGTSSATACALTYSLITSDYYFNRPASSFAPFLGGGFGSYSIDNIQVLSNTNTSTPNVAIDHKFGGLLRGGFEAGHFRMGLEYYLIPRSTLYDPYGTVAGSTGNNFLNLFIGFYLGGGHWKK